MHEHWIGRTIGGRYQIDTLLGQGGMSAVYRATDPNLRRQVAIKLIHPHLSVNPNFVSRFKEEAAAVARLRHPNIVQVHDFNNDGETYYMVMEYLIGETLQARLRRLGQVNRFMPVGDAVTFCSQLCSAVGYAHKHELVHRDIKPANVMLDMNGQAILMDFGIVKIIGGEYHTATGATVGTAQYMSPEQIRSERADERSDIYSLGVTLYEMLSGRTPYQADSAVALMMMVLNDPLPDLRDFRRGVPDALAAVVERAVAKEPKDRFQTMEEMAGALHEAQANKEGIASLATVADDEHKSKTLATIAMAEGSTPGQLAVADTAPGQTAQTAGRQDTEQAVTGVPATAAAVAAPVAASPRTVGPARTGFFARLKRKQVFVSAVVLVLLAAAVAFLVTYLRHQQPPLAKVAAVSDSTGPINSETARSVVSLAMWETGSPIEQLAFDPTGNWIGTVNDRDTLPLAKYRFFGGLWPIRADQAPFYLLGHKGWVNGGAFSPDGQLFATASDDDTIILWRVTDGSQVNVLESSIGGSTSVDFSPNGLLLATGGWDGSVTLWQVSDGHLLRTLQGHTNSVNDVSFSPNGDLIASASDDGSIKLWGVSDGMLANTFDVDSGSIKSLAFSPDGSLLATACEDSSIGLWDIGDSSLVRRMDGHSEPVMKVAFSSDGSLLASASEDQSLRLWRVADGELLSILAKDLDGITSIAFSPDGSTLISGEFSGSLRFWGLSEAIPLETQ